MNVPPKRCVCYLRQSQARPGESSDSSLSLSSQLEEITAYCERQGWTIVDTIRDHDLSGEKWDRPGLHALLSRIKAGGVDAVIVYALNRLARKLAYQETVVDILAEHGVEIYSVSEAGIDNVLVRAVHGGMAQQHNTNLRKVIRANLETRAKRGLHHGRPPFGYVAAGTREAGKRLELVPEEAAVVQRIFRLRADGWSTTAIANALNSEGLTTKQGKPFHDTSIRVILRTPTYAGYAIHQGQIIGDLADGIAEPIIDRTLYQQVQRTLNGQRSVRPKPVGSWLEGLVRHGCGNGMSLTRAGGPTADYTPAARRIAFRCNRVGKVAHYRCGLRPTALNQEGMERAVIACLLTDLRTRPTDPADLLRRRAEELGKPDAVKRRAQLIRQKSNLLSQVKRAEQLVTSGRRDFDWFDAFDSEVQTKLMAIDQEMETLTALPTEDEMDALVATVARLIPVSPALLELVADAHPEELRPVLAALGHVVFDGTVRIAYAPEFRAAFPNPTVIRPVYVRTVGGPNVWRLDVVED